MSRKSQSIHQFFGIGSSKAPGSIQINKISSPTPANQAMALNSLSTLFCVVAVAFLIEGSVASPQDDNQYVNGSNYWVVKIAEEACLPGNHDEASTEKIFRCYFEIPKTETFLGCQFKTFGHYLNSERNMDDFCNRWNETFVYYACNQQSFADAGQSDQLPAIVEKLNLCQAKVLGLGQFNQTQTQPQRPSGPVGQFAALYTHLQQLLQALSQHGK